MQFHMPSHPCSWLSYYHTAAQFSATKDKSRRDKLSYRTFKKSSVAYTTLFLKTKRKCRFPCYRESMHLFTTVPTGDCCEQRQCEQRVLISPFIFRLTSAL